MGASELADCNGISDGSVVLSSQAHCQLSAACYHAEKLLGSDDETVATEHLKLLLRTLMTLRRELP